MLQREIVVGLIEEVIEQERARSDTAFVILERIAGMQDGWAAISYARTWFGDGETLEARTPSEQQK